MPTGRLQRPEPSEYNPRFLAEIGSVPDADDFSALIRRRAGETVAFVQAEFGEEHAGLRYAPDKWTVREVVGHLADVERVLSYRALCVARGDQTVLPGFDENAYVPAGQFETRTLRSVLDEFMAVRGATAALVASLTDEQAARRGNIGSGTMTARALLYLAAGHELHHVTLFRERYLPCIAAGASR